MEHEGTPVPAETEAPPVSSPGVTQEPGQPPKPDPEPVQPVNDEELDNLEQEGAADVNEMSCEEATADETVDNEENDQGV